MVWFSTVPAGFFLTLRLKNKTKGKNMKTEMEKMRSGELYYFSGAEMQESFKRAAALCARMRTMSVYDENYRKTIEELIPGIPSDSVVCPPFHCDHGTGVL